MTDRKPLKVLPDGGGDSTGLGEFVAADTIGIADGGTGSTFGLLSVNPSGAALASQNAHKIILVDLTDPSTMWDIEAFLARVRHTSWYEELGAPPMRGAIWITEAQTSMVWWDLDTDSQFIKFDVGGSSNSDANMLYFSASSPPDSLVFLDGKIFYGATNGGGAWIIDFLRDECIGWFASGQRQYSGAIKERNDGNGNVATISTAIVNGTVNAVAAMRDPLSFDEFDRPKHWWSVGTAAGACIYNPHDDAIYDWHDSSRTSTKQFLANGRWFFTRNQTTYTGVNYINGFGVSADQPTVITHFNPWDSASNTNNSKSSLPWDKSATISDIAGNDDASRVAVSSDEGICLVTLCDEYQMYGWNWITSSYQTPYMKGPRGGAYPLNDLNDRSGGGLNLTNTGSTPQATGPLGANTAYDFSGSGQMLEVESNAAQVGTNKLTVSCWFNPDAASGEEALVAKYDSTAATDNWMLTVFGADMRFVVNSGNTSYIATGAALATGQWYHAAGVYDGAYVRLYLNGVEASTKAALTGNMDTHTVKMTIGAEADNNHNFNGKISQVSIQMAAWTENEVKLEYQRMVRALGGATGTLANDNVKSVRIDHNSGLAAITTAVPSGGTAGQGATEIWDITTGLRESIDGTTTATVNDADVALKSGADDPEYITGRSGAIEFDGKARRVIG